MNRRCIGLLAERYSKWERRAALTPSHVQQLVSQNIDVLVQPSTSRVYSDAEYSQAGASLTNDLSDAAAILGVKQPANGTLLPEKTYLFFSHVIKAQPENMALLDELLDKRCRLIDYECVREGGGGSTARLIAFGGFAGKAGIINGLRGLGLRLLGQGYSTPFLAIGPAYSYQDYNQAKQALAEVGAQIARGGLPAAVSPLVTTICGTGNVSKGAVDALGALGDVLRWVSPAELPGLSALHATEGEHQRHVYACVVGTEHLVAHAEAHASPPHPAHAALAHHVDTPFDRSHYYANPHEYVPVFHETIAPHTSLLVPTMYWDRRFPRLLSLEQLAALRASGNSRLLAVADLTCDVGGAVEALVRSSTIDAPYYVYDVEARAEGTDGLDGNGLLMMGVDILPSELPKEASQHFGELLLPFIAPLTTRGAPLPAELAGATIVDAGRLQPGYQYIQAMRAAYDRSQEAAQAEEAGKQLTPQRRLALEGSTVLALHGHLFDSGLINAALDLIEQAGGRFDLLEVNVRPNPTDSGDPYSGDRLSPRTPSSALLQVTLDQGRPALDAVIGALHEMVRRMPLAGASFHELEHHCGGVYDRTILDTIALDHTAIALESPHTPTAPLPPTPAAAPPAAAPPTTAPPATSSMRAARVGGRSVGGRSVLVLGAGLCAAPAVELLSRDLSRDLSREGGDQRTHVRVVSATPGEAEALCSALGRPNVLPHAMDAVSALRQASEKGEVSQMLAEADAVLSLLPAPLHAAVAEQCIAARTPLVTASYVSPELDALHERARKAGVPLLCEMGLDPGLDHMSAAAMIAQVHSEGGEVVSFRSVCGGLPAPESAFSGNPFGYKFSWSPAGVLAAMTNAAQWRQAGEVVRVAGTELLRAAQPLSGGLLGRALSLEVLPNRDALPYAVLYGIDGQAATFFRGTLRYQGWSELMDGLVALGLTQPMPTPAGAHVWPQLLHCLGVPRAVSGSASTLDANGTRRADTARARAAAALHWLGAWDERAAVAGGTVVEAFCALLESRLRYGEGERDAVLMEHTLGVAYADSRPAKTLSSSLVGFGARGGDSAMSRSVGLTAAMGVHRVMAPPSVALPPLAGVVRPTERSVWEYCLPRLGEEGLRFQENEEESYDIPALL